MVILLAAVFTNGLFYVSSKIDASDLDLLTKIKCAVIFSVIRFLTLLIDVMIILISILELSRCSGT